MGTHAISDEEREIACEFEDESQWSAKKMLPHAECPNGDFALLTILIEVTDARIWRNEHEKRVGGFSMREEKMPDATF
jgi:hypothetical protein